MLRLLSSFISFILFIHLNHSFHSLSIGQGLLNANASCAILISFINLIHSALNKDWQCLVCYPYLIHYLNSFSVGQGLAMPSLLSLSYSLT